MERRRLAGEIRALVSSRLERRGFLAAFTERTGGTSPPPFSSLNLGGEIGDRPDLVEENRRRLAEALNIGEPSTVRQVHGARVVSVGSQTAADELGDADGMSTSAAGLPLAVMVADCVPLVLASEREGVLAAIHVGWRGLAAGVVQAAVRSFSEPSVLVAAIGPSIGPCHYEVGPGVVRAVGAGTGGLALTADGGRRLDLPGTVAAVLRGEGVEEQDRARECTACESGRFFSHRRDGPTGRQALVAVRL